MKAGMGLSRRPFICLSRANATKATFQVGCRVRERKGLGGVPAPGPWRQSQLVAGILSKNDGVRFFLRRTISGCGQEYGGLVNNA